MAQTNSFSVIFLIRKKNKNGNKQPIYCRISVDGSKKEFATKLFIEEAFWNKNSSLVNNRTEESKKINPLLESIKGKLITLYNQYLFNNAPINAEILKNKYFGIDTENKNLSVLELFDFHNSEMKDILEWGTLKNYFTTKKYFETYIKFKYKRTDISLQELNYQFLSSFEAFMRKEYTSINPERPCSNNTIMKHIERFRKIINLAIKNEWIERDPFVKFQPKYINKERDFLTPSELKKIEDKTFSIPRLQHVKDLFVFSCYTGLAYIDVFNLEPGNINFGINGKLWLNTSRQKTNQIVRIPLLPKAQEIVLKYENDEVLKKKGKLLPQFSNQKLNSYLKEIADCCRITKNLTFHVARHTFATSVTLSNGVPIETVSKLLGHTTLRMTQVYARVVETKVMNDMDILSEKLQGKNEIKFRKVK